MKRVTKSGAAFTASGTKMITREKTDSKSKEVPLKLELSIKEWLRELRLEKIETKQSKRRELK